MNTRIIAATCLIMTFSGLLFLSEVRGRLNGAKEHQELAEFWKSRIAREQLKKLIVMGQFADFKQDVALLIPEHVNKEKNDERKNQLRQLASIIPHEKNHEITLGYSAEKFLKQGKDFIKAKEYLAGLVPLKKLINKFPDSHHVIEAHYLIVEAYSKKNSSKEVIEWVDKMVELFPADRLTGFALLKVGELYEKDGRSEDAIKIYKTIVSTYQDKVLTEQAKSAVSQLEL
jgi:TolA-binding protein